MDTIQDFMASSHLMESGPIIASLYVIGSQLFNNNSFVLKSLFDYAFNQFSEVQQIFRYPVLQHFVDTRAMSVVAVSRTASGIALLCSFCSGSITLSNSIVLPLKFNEKLLLEKQPTLRQTNFAVWICSGKNTQFSPGDN